MALSAFVLTASVAIHGAIGIDMQRAYMELHK